MAARSAAALARQGKPLVIDALPGLFCRNAAQNTRRIFGA